MNQLINLELSEENNPTLWLHYNNNLEDNDKYLQNKVSKLKRKIDEVNLMRKTEQEAIREELQRSLSGRDHALMKAWQIKAYCDQLEVELKKTKYENNQKFSPLAFSS